jgi:hypothetical protein
MAKVHTPGPGDERPGAAGGLAGSLLNEGTAGGLEVPPSRTFLEAAAGRAALAACRHREANALANENYGQRDAVGMLAERQDAIALRGIVALCLPTNPKANAEPLGCV